MTLNLRIPIMRCIHKSSCQYSGLEKSVEAPPEQLPSVVFTLSVFSHIFLDSVEVNIILSLCVG